MLFFQKDFWFKIFFAENIWAQIWGRETKYFGAWCIHISPSLSKIHIMGHPKRSKKFRLRSKIQLMGYSQNFY